MAKGLKGNSRGANSVLEKPFLDRLIAIEERIRSLREDKKQVKIEAKEHDLKCGPLDRAVVLHFETEEHHNARLEKEAEAQRILRACGYQLDLFDDDGVARAATIVPFKDALDAGDTFLRPETDPPEAA